MTLKIHIEPIGLEEEMLRVLYIWLEASIKVHDFVSPIFWESQIANMKNIYLPASDVYVAKIDGQVVGFYAQSEDQLAAIFVALNWQNNGIGSKLLQHAQSKTKNLKLTVYKKNIASFNFYKKHGFNKISEQIDSHTGEIEILMEWWLS